MVHFGFSLYGARQDMLDTAYSASAPHEIRFAGFSWGPRPQEKNQIALKCEIPKFNEEKSDMNDDNKSKKKAREIDNLDNEIKVLRQQVGELTEALQRERADTENIRRRHEQQIDVLKSMVKASIIRDLLPAIDNLERSLKHVPKEIEDNNFVKGVQSVVKQFEKTFKDIGIERIKTIGEEFDPKVHEAIAMDEDGIENGNIEIVSDEIQTGFRMGDDVIRHALVKVKLGKK